MAEYLIFQVFHVLDYTLIRSPRINNLREITRAPDLPGIYLKNYYRSVCVITIIIPCDHSKLYQKNIDMNNHIALAIFSPL